MVFLIVNDLKLKKALAALRDIAKYFSLEVVSPISEKPKKYVDLNGVTIIPADSTIDPTELTKIFTGKDIDPVELRKQGKEKNNLRYGRNVRLLGYCQISPYHPKSTPEKSIELYNVVISAITRMELMLGAVNKADMAKTQRTRVGLTLYSY